MPTANASTVVPQHTDDREREPSDQLTLLAPLGQLALPGSVAQLGLDGAAYAPAPTSPRSGEPFLGRATRGFAATAPGEGEGEERGGDPPGDLPPDPADYERLLRASLNPAAPARQLVLFAETWEASPRQLTMWPQLEARLALVAEREQKCQYTRFRKDSDVGAHRSPSGRWSLSDVISCGRATCPACGRRKARSTAALLGVCFERHREMYPDGDHWMFTIAVPHLITDGVERSNGWLYDGSARFWRSLAWVKFAERWGIDSRVRVYDAVHGGTNGTHPHFHVALFPTRARVPAARLIALQMEELGRQIRKEKGERRRRRLELRPTSTPTEQRRREEADRAWELEQAGRLVELEAARELATASGELWPLRDASQEVRRTFLRELVGGLLPAWRTALGATGCPHPVNAHAVDLLPSEKAEAYFVKWGLAEEIGLSVEKDRSHLRLLDIVCASLGAQSDIAADLYREFNDAMAGRAWVTGLARTCKRYGVTDDDEREYIARMRERRSLELERDGLPPLPEVPELHLVVRSHLWRAFLGVGHAEVFAWIDAASERLAHDGARVQLELDDFLWRNSVLTRVTDTS